MAQLTTAVILVALPLFFTYLVSAVRWRRFRQYGAFPQSKPSLLFGHLRIFHEQTQQGDPKRHPDMVFGELAQTIGNPPITLFDLRPLQHPILLITDHEIAEQVSKASKTYPYSTPKSPTMGALHPIVGPNSMITTDGEFWKSWRKRFNPGFAPQHLMTLLPCILDKTRIFLEHMDRFAASGEEFRMEYYATGLTFDIIGAVVMDLDFKAQQPEDQQSETLKLFRAMMTTFTGVADIVPIWMRPRLAIRRWLIARQLHAHMQALVRQQYKELRAQQGAATNGKPSKSRSVLALSLQDTAALTPSIIDATCDQLKSFLFAGHDTTSILLQWALYELERTPRALAALRAELDGLFGPSTDPEAVRSQLLRRGDDIMSRMTYTSAVIKETLRLHPPAASARMSPPGSGMVVRDPQSGQDVCVDGLVLYPCHSLLQRDETVYGPTAGVFHPERWLGNTDTSEMTNSGLEVDEGEKRKGTKEKDGGANIPASAWRPFERGPRNCIGQELANIEARVILACAVRRYDFTKVGLGELVVGDDGKPVMGKLGQFRVKSELFNTVEITSKPIDGCVMRAAFSAKATAERASQI